MYYYALGLILKSLVYPAFRMGERLFPSRKQRLREMRGQGLPPYRKQQPSEIHLWIHGASLGESGVVVKLVRQLEQDAPDIAVTFTLSAGTATGVSALKTKLGSRAAIHFAPLDFPGWPDQALQVRKPDAMIFVETEIWPHWIQACKRGKIPVFLVNGRISPQSFPRYRKISGLLKKVFSCMDSFSMISTADAERIRKIGAPAERIRVCGNIKRDMLLQKHLAQIPEKEALCLGKNARIWVCGSIRHGEEIPILQAYTELKKDFPDLCLILAPRHLKRLSAMEKAADKAGFHHERLSSKKGRPAPVLFLDTMGALLHYYSLADVVFCGGSLVPLGGQNLLEAASCGKPVLFGPSMENFEDEKKLLMEAGAALEVGDEKELFGEISRLLRSPEEARAMGERGLIALKKSGGATACHVRTILEHLRMDRS